MTIKLEQKGHISKKDKADKAQVKEILADSAKNIKPADFLETKEQKDLFKWLISAAEDVSFSELDSFQLSMLSVYLVQFSDSVRRLNKLGAIINEKKSPEFSIMKTTSQQISRLMKELNLSQNQRVKQLLNKVKNEEIADPFKELLASD